MAGPVGYVRGLTMRSFMILPEMGEVIWKSRRIFSTYDFGGKESGFSSLIITRAKIPERATVAVGRENLEILGRVVWPRRTRALE